MNKWHLLAIAGAVAVVLGVSACGAKAGPPATAGTSAPASVPAYTPPPAAATTPPPDVTVHFSCTGSGQPSITYGSDTDSITPPGSLGELGNGVPLPWHAKLKFDPDAEYYSINAQLQGGGSIKCQIRIQAAGYSTLTYTGRASGGYNIADVQVAPVEGSNGLQWQSEG
jgi:hypothetical protein